jgi:hypothetical protein
MLITPRPGVDRDTVLRAIKQAHEAADNLRSAGPHTAYGRLLSYLEWSTLTVQSLRYQISTADIDRLILTPRHAALLAGVSDLAHASQQRLVNGLIDLELTDRVEALDEAAKTLKETITRWSWPGAFVVADSSFYIQHHTMLAEADLHEALSFPTGDDIRLLFPIVVIDELDRLKEAGKQRPRWRAGHTLGVLDGILSTTGIGTLRRRQLPELPANPSGPVIGEITAEVVFDQPGHTRLPNPDDEIIDRALAVKSLAGRDVHLLTYDTGQATRGRLAGLAVHKLSGPDLGDEPDWAAEEAKQAGGNGGRAARREKQRAAREGASERDETLTSAESWPGESRTAKNRTSAPSDPGSSDGASEPHHPR